MALYRNIDVNQFVQASRKCNKEQSAALVCNCMCVRDRERQMEKERMTRTHLHDLCGRKIAKMSLPPLNLAQCF